MEKYNYEFSIWIDGKNSGTWSKVANNLLQRTLSCRQVEENITEKDFGNLREELWHKGFELHEITRKPYIEAEIIK